jgi:general nucleoside transport system ATP-binding protein
VIQLEGIVKHYDGIAALDGASLGVSRGTVHAVLGENGAGKTTLMRVAFGMVRPEKGTIAVDGVMRRFGSPAAAIAAGIGMVHQHYALVPAMTVAENVALGMPGWRYDRADAEARVEAIGAEMRLAAHAGAKVETLSVGEQQRVEIIKALARAARVLILDEPTAVLDPAATKALLAWLRRFADRGGAVVLVTHKLREALSIADEVTVLRAGKTVLTAPVARDRGNPARMAGRETELAAAMLGTDASVADARVAAGIAATGLGATSVGATGVVVGATGVVVGATGVVVGATGAGAADAPVVVRAQQVDLIDARGVTRVVGATFVVRAGEIVGVAAAEGAGHGELMRALAARTRIARGKLELPPIEAIGFVAEDRHRDALVLDFSLTENIALRGARWRRGRMRWRAFRTHTQALVEAFDVRAARVSVAARTLSGGNQQKLVLARELDAAPHLLVAENPTRGLDILATSEIHSRMVAARTSGTAVVFYSSDLDEVVALSDRILVIADGAVREVPAAFDRESVGRRMLGVSA